MNAAPSFYVTGGTLRPDAPSYVERQADRDLYDGLSRGEFCYVLTARQMGKSSLMARTAQRLREEGVTVVVLDLTAIGQNLSAEQWYDGLRWLLGQQLNLDDALDDFWLAHERLGPLQRWLAALHQVVLARMPGRIVIFVEEVDTVLSLPFSTDEFFAGIREGYNRRAHDPEFGRLTFCLLGVASPSDLIRDTRTTPFNIGRRIVLTDFTEAEAAPLAEGLGEARPIGGAVLKRVLYWTGGHPYLTQRLCQAVAQEPGKCDPARVDALCERLYLSHRARERDDNLLFVRDRLLRSDEDVSSLLGLYARVRSPREKVADDEANPLVSALRLSGIVREENGYLRVRNRIYAWVFDRAWIEANMPDAEVRRLRAAAREEARKRRQAEELQRTTRRLLYAAQMNLAQQAWDVGNVGRAWELLDAQRPGRGEADLRGFEWRYLWRLCQGDAAISWRAHDRAVAAVAFSPNGALLATSDAGWEWRQDPGTVKLWDVAARQEIGTFSAHAGGVFTLAFAPDGRTLASGSADQTLRLWDVAGRREIACFAGHTGWVYCVRFSPDGKRLATGSYDNTARVWDVATGRTLAVLRGHAWSVQPVAFSPDGGILATGSRDNTIKLWDLATACELATLSGHTGHVESLAFSPDGRLLLSGAQDNSAKLWDVPTYREVATLKGHTGVVGPVAFSPDGNLLATGSGDGTVRVWDAEARQTVKTLRGHRSDVVSVAFSPDGCALASGSDDQTVRLWELDSEGGADVLPVIPTGSRAWCFLRMGACLLPEAVMPPCVSGSWIRGASSR